MERPTHRRTGDRTNGRRTREHDTAAGGVGYAAVLAFALVLASYPAVGVGVVLGVAGAFAVRRGPAVAAALRRAAERGRATERTPDRRVAPRP